MSLTQDLTEIEGFKTLCYDTRTTEPPNPRRKEKNPDGSVTHYVDLTPNPWSEEPNEDGEWVRTSTVTTVLTFACIAVGMGKITRENVAEFIFRKRLLDIAVGERDLITTEEWGLEEFMRERGLDDDRGAIWSAVEQGLRVRANGVELKIPVDDVGSLTDEGFEAVERALDPEGAEVVLIKRSSRNLTDEEIVSHIGLVTNVGFEDRESWLARRVGGVIGRLDARISRMEG